jgi:hypothetical protein
LIAAIMLICRGIEHDLIIQPAMKPPAPAMVKSGAAG